MYSIYYYNNSSRPQYLFNVLETVILFIIIFFLHQLTKLFVFTVYIISLKETLLL